MRFRVSGANAATKAWSARAQRFEIRIERPARQTRDAYVQSTKIRNVQNKTVEGNDKKGERMGGRSERSGSKRETNQARVPKTGKEKIDDETHFSTSQLLCLQGLP